MMMLVLRVKKEKVCVFSVNLSFDKTWQKNNFSDKWRRKARVQKPVFPTLPISLDSCNRKHSLTKSGRNMAYLTKSIYKTPKIGVE